MGGSTGVSVHCKAQGRCVQRRGGAPWAAIDVENVDVRDAVKNVDVRDAVENVDARAGGEGAAPRLKDTALLTA